MIDFSLVSVQQRYPTNSKADGTETDLNLDQKVSCKGDQQCKCLLLDCTVESALKYSTCMYFNISSSLSLPLLLPLPSIPCWFSP